MRTSSLCLALTVLLHAPVRADVTVHDPIRSIDPGRVTVEAEVQQLGKDPKKIFEYVRDHIRNDAYVGVLRGGRGTLLAEAGNSLDKAILLRELLSAAGAESRLAHGQLDVAAQGRFRDGVFRMPQRAEGKKAAPALAALLESIQTETQERYAAITKALSDASFTAPAVTASAGEGADHYWVQVHQGDSWVDLDPCLPDLPWGQAATAAKETLDEVPADRFHQVVVTLTLEEEKDGKPSRRTLLTYETKACDLSGVSLLLTHQEASWEKPEPMEALAGGLHSAFESLAGHAPEDRIKPVLVVGLEYKEGEAFDLLHPLREDLSKPLPAPSGLASIGYDPEAAEAERKRIASGTSGEWIEVEFRSPDGRVDRTERTVFDRLGLAARQQGAGKPAEAPLGLQHPLTAFFCLSFYTGPLANEAMYAKERASGAHVVSGKKDGEAYDLEDALEGMNHVIAAFSDQAVSPLRVGEDEVLFCHSSPRLVISSIRASGEVGALSVDLRRADYRPVCRTDALAAKAFQFQLLRGVADGVIEARLMDFLLSREECGKAGVDVRESATEVFREAAHGGVGTLVWRGEPKDLPPGVSEEAAARLTADAAAGRLIVLPERPVKLGGKERMAWWRIDPACGDAVGVTEDGLHGVNGIEYISIVKYRAEGIATIAVYYAGGMVRAYQYPVAKLEELICDCHFFQTPWNITYR